MSAPLGVNLFLKLSCFISQRTMLLSDGFMASRNRCGRITKLTLLQSNDGVSGESGRTFCNSSLTSDVRS